VGIVCDATLAFIKRWKVLSAIIEMADFREQSACTKFCFKLGKTATECYEMLETAFGEQAIGRSQTFKWFSRFKAGRNSIDDDERSGRPMSSSTPEMTERERHIIREDRRRTIDEVSMLVGISHGTCHKILTEDLKMRRVASKFVPRLLSVDQKQQRLDVCLDIKENAADDPRFLSNVITGDETWVYAYDPETKTQSSQWKSPRSPRPKKARQVRSNIKSMSALSAQYRQLLMSQTKCSCKQSAHIMITIIIIS